MQKLKGLWMPVEVLLNKDLSDKEKNKYLFNTTKLSDIKNYGKFNNYGYRGIYN